MFKILKLFIILQNFLEQIILAPLSSIEVLSTAWPAGQNWPFGVFCLALLIKNFCNGYWPFNDWVGEIQKCCEGDCTCTLFHLLVCTSTNEQILHYLY